MVLTVINSIIAENKIAKNLIKSENNCTFRNKKLPGIQYLYFLPVVPAFKTS